ncbi:helix-turn-helix domain-containing protein [Paraburkholderia diazotrophica]|uniref:AraC family transcriptional regulator n=1 Tax=Paraburkholderia diazotrophica TaxID=667676 RepID=A0A1H7BX36_9BURK|nr:AraC family transcriptional regulator [Paraburkholderia diazotrophica]SEJ81958.1 AraC family transcriptional regulator [Paraburkholderia diazotrophica]
MTALTQRPAGRTIDAFAAVPGARGLEYCISGAQPYTFDVHNTSDTVCLLLGTIVSNTRYDDGPALPLTFRAETAAFHPRGGRMHIDAQQVRLGFVAFRYSDEFKRGMNDAHADASRSTVNRDNLGADAIRHLVRYARIKTASNAALPVDSWEIQCLATLAWIETTRQLQSAKDLHPSALSSVEFDRLEQYVDENLDCTLSCTQIAATLDLPVRVVSDGVKARTGHSLYRFVVEKRLNAAARMLRVTDTPLCDVAAACGFSSQQHMTALFSERMGTTPSRYRKHGA